MENILFKFGNSPHVSLHRLILCTSQRIRFKFSRLSSSVILMAILRQVVARRRMSRFLIFSAAIVRSKRENARQYVSHCSCKDCLNLHFRTFSIVRFQKLWRFFRKKKRHVSNNCGVYIKNRPTSKIGLFQK